MKKIILGVLALVFLILAGGMLVPSHCKASRSIVIQAKPQAIYPLVADWRNWDKWAAFKVPDAVITHSGKASGVGAVCFVKSKSMEITNEIVKADPATGITYECSMPGWPKSSGIIAFSPEGNATKVEYSFEGNNGYNPIARIFSLFMMPKMKKAFEDGLNNLKKIAETKAGK